MAKLVRLVRLNGLQYNANRDPQVYRRVVGERFRVEALVAAGVRCTLRDARGAILAAVDVPAGGSFVHELEFDRPGVHVVTFTAERNGESFVQDLRLDVLARAWIG